MSNAASDDDIEIELPSLSPYTMEEAQRRAQLGLSNLLGKPDSPFDVTKLSNLSLAWRYVLDGEDDFQPEVVAKIDGKTYLFQEDGIVREVPAHEMLGDVSILPLSR